MSIESPVVLRGKQQILLDKLASLDRVDRNITTNRNWARDRVLTGTSKAVNLRIDDELRKQAPELWAKNVVRAGRIRLSLRTAKSNFEKQFGEGFGYILDEPEQTDPRDFSTILQSEPVQGYLDEVTDDYRRLVGAFFTSPESQRMLSIVANITIESPEQEQKLQSDIAGAMFEQMAFADLKPKYERPRTVLLSPAEVYAVYKNLNPDNESESIGLSGITRGIPGVTFPDGLLIEETADSLVVRAAFEYKSWSHLGHNSSQAHQYSTHGLTLARGLKTVGEHATDPLYIGNLVHHLRPELSIKPLVVDPQSKLIYGLPFNSGVRLPAHIKVEPIAVNTRELSQLVGALKYLTCFASVS